jgi:hypothetical protein
VPGFSVSSPNLVVEVLNGYRRIRGTTAKAHAGTTTARLKASSKTSDRVGWV